MPRLLPILALALATSACSLPTTSTKPSAEPPSTPAILLDFEKPNPAVTWVSDAPATAPAQPETAPASQPNIPPDPLQRTSHLPHSGLWSLATALTTPGQIRYTSPKPLDLSSRDVLTAQITHADAPARNGHATAALILTDAAGTAVRGDAFPILSHWQPITFDLRLAQNQGLDLARITTISLALFPAQNLADTPLPIQTDSWATQSAARYYQGSSVGPAKTFYVESRGTRLVVGSVGQYEITLTDHGTPSLPQSGDQSANPAHAPASLAIATPAKIVLGQPATGLNLLDQSALEILGALRRQDPDPSPIPSAAPTPNPPPTGRIPDTPWPNSLAPNLAAIHWSVVWTSPLAAIVEGTQENGPYDHLGIPAVTIKWQLMIYQWGQVFVHARWSKSPDLPVPDPITWALATEEIPPLPAAGAAPDRLLADIYTPLFRENLRTALPHDMQATAPVALIAKTTPQKDSFCGAAGITSDGLRRHLFGVALAKTAALPPQNAELPTQNSGEADCMLLVNNPDPLTKATTFSQYLDPPKVIVRQGELDRNFPGDTDNDGFVESYGFQVIRLSNGRATFTIYPQQRPIFYPPFLFTVPTVERDALDLKHSKLLINIDGKQFSNPPQFPDGSFLLQIPYMLDGQQPVSVEAILVK